MDGLGDVIFAYEMNDEELPRYHGYPVRVILPWHAGCRQAKWVHKVILSDKESDKPWHQIPSFRSRCNIWKRHGSLASRTIRSSLLSHKWCQSGVLFVTHLKTRF
jgi:DMSO/TMAO reductase YedYZ molybdopterin-dependent catalytic subunit